MRRQLLVFAKSFNFDNVMFFVNFSSTVISPALSAAEMIRDGPLSMIKRIP